MSDTIYIRKLPDEKYYVKLSRFDMKCQHTSMDIDKEMSKNPYVVCDDFDFAFLKAIELEGILCKEGRKLYCPIRVLKENSKFSGY